MGIRQLSVFLANKKGSLHEISDVIAKAGVDLRSMCIADTSDYGIVRVIADDPRKAADALNVAGHTASIRTVTAFAVPDVPGGLSNVLCLLEENNVNIEYLYALVTTNKDKAYAVMRTDDSERTEAILRDNGVEILEENQI